jgi:hypothetical protein
MSWNVAITIAAALVTITRLTADGVRGCGCEIAGVDAGNGGGNGSKPRRLWSHDRLIQCGRGNARRALLPELVVLSPGCSLHQPSNVSLVTKKYDPPIISSNRETIYFDIRRRLNSARRGCRRTAGATARRKVDEKQHVMCHESSQRAHLDTVEVCRNETLPMRLQESMEAFIWLMIFPLLRGDPLRLLYCR